MKVWSLAGLQNVRDFEGLKNFLTQGLQSFSQALTGNLTLSDNLRCRIVTIGPSTDNPDFAFNSGFTPMVNVTHNLGTDKVGFFVINQPGSGAIWQPDTYPATTSQIYFNSDNITITYRVVILPWG